MARITHSAFHNRRHSKVVTHVPPCPPDEPNPQTVETRFSASKDSGWSTNNTPDGKVETRLGASNLRMARQITPSPGIDARTRVSTSTPCLHDDSNTPCGISAARTLCMAVLTMVLAIALAACGSKPSADNSEPHKLVIPPRDTTSTYDGIDVSSHQGNIDWEMVRRDSSLRFVYVKATEGRTYRSPHYARNVSMAQQQGLLVGSYHYLTTTSSMHAQFQNFIDQTSPLHQDLIPMIDIEHRGRWSRHQLIDSVTVFARLLEHYYGVKPMIYSTMTFYNTNLAPYFNKYPLYIGRYSKKEPQLKWDGKYTIWQFSEHGIIAGIDAYVDLCHYHDSGWLDEITLPQQ